MIQGLFYTTSSRGSPVTDTGGTNIILSAAFSNTLIFFSLIYKYLFKFIRIAFFYKMFYSLFPGAMNPPCSGPYTGFINSVYLTTLSKGNIFFPFIKEWFFCAVPFFLILPCFQNSHHFLWIPVARNLPYEKHFFPTSLARSFWFYRQHFLQFWGSGHTRDNIP